MDLCTEKCAFMHRKMCINNPRPLKQAKFAKSFELNHTLSPRLLKMEMPVRQGLIAKWKNISSKIPFLYQFPNSTPHLGTLFEIKKSKCID